MNPVSTTNPMALKVGPPIGPIAGPPLTSANPIALVDPITRQLVRLDDPSRLPDLMDLGYRPATPDEVHIHEMKEQYDTFGQTAAAFGEGALDTVVPVIGPAIERALGVSAEDQALRAQFHPVARGAGQVVGAVGGAMTGVGAPGLIARAGTGVAARVGGGLLGSALGAATEGALYSVSDVANQAVLGNPGLTAESALRQIGVTTAISGGLGLLSGLAKGFARDHAEQWAGDLRDFSADRTMKALGGIQSDRADLVKRYGEEGYLKLMQEISEHPMKPVGPFSTAKTSYDTGAKMLDDAWAAMDAELKAAGHAGAYVTGDDLLGRFGAVVDEMRANPWAQSAAKKLDEVINLYGQRFQNRVIPLYEVHALRRQISDQIGYARGAIDFDSNLTKGAMHEFRNAMSDSIDDALNKVGIGTEGWKAANRQYQLGSVVQKLAQRGINRAEGNNIVSPTELLTGLASAGFLGEAGEAGIPLVEHALGRGLIGTAASALIRRQGSHVLAWAGTRAAKGLEALHAGLESEIGAAVDKAFSGVGGIAAMKTSEMFTPDNFQERAAAVTKYLSDPSAQAALSDPTLDAYAGPVMDELRARVAAAAGVLGSNIPKYDVTGPLDPVFQPSATDLARLNRTAEVARDPMAILEQMARGTLLPDHVQTLDTVWPAYAAAIRAKALDRLATGLSKGEVVPPRLRYGLGLLFGQDLSRSTSAAAVAAAQQAYASHAPPQNAPPPPGSRASYRVRDVETHLGSRAATSTDAAVRHLQE